MRLSRLSSHTLHILTLLLFLATPPLNHHYGLALAEPLLSVDIAPTTATTSPSIAVVSASPSSFFTQLTTTTTTMSPVTTTVQRALSTTSTLQSTLTVQSTPPPLLVSGRCKFCPPGNTLGFTCFKDTQCVPVSLLCNMTTSSSNLTTTDTNPCVDTTGLPSPDDPITCRDQLCYPENYLPLPSPGSGRINSNSVANCVPGNYFALYGSVLSGMRYTRSCNGKFSAGSTIITCNNWEYRGQSSCFLRTCGPGMDCETPFVCRKKKSILTSMEQPFGLCTNPNSTDTEDENGIVDGTTDRDRLLLGVLVGVCMLVFVVAIGAAFWHIRKTRLKLLAQLHTADNDHVLHQKTLLLYACCCLGSSTRSRHGGGGGASDDRAATDGSPRGPRVVAIVESESQEDSGITDHRSNIILSRRWRWGQGLSGALTGATTTTTTGITAGGIAVLPEFEPPPIYHQESELPSYSDGGAIPLRPINPAVTQTLEIMSRAEESTPANDEERAMIPTPGLR